MPENNPTKTLNQETLAWIEKNSELVKRLERLREVGEEASSDMEILEEAERAVIEEIDRLGAEALRQWLLLDHDGHLPCFACITEGRVADVKVAQQLSLPPGSIVVMDREANSIIRADQIGQFNLFEAGRRITGTYSRVVVWLEDKQEEMELITNRLDLAAETIGDLPPTVADRTVFQSHQTKSAYQNLRRRLRQCRTYPDLDSTHRHASDQVPAV